MYFKIIHLLKLIRYQEWQDKIQSMAVAAIILLIYSDNLFIHTQYVIIFLLYLYFAYSYGYLINSYADRKADIKLGQDRYEGFTERHVKSLIYLLAMLVFAVPFLFRNVFIICIMIAGMFLASFYSVKPLRLKERGLAGLIASTISQRAPYLFFLFLMPNHTKMVLYVFGWLTIVGFIIEASQQLGDITNDRKTSTKTFALLLGREDMVRLIYTAEILLIIYILLPAILNKQGGLLFTLVFFVFSYNAHDYAKRNISACA